MCRASGRRPHVTRRALRARCRTVPCGRCACTPVFRSRLRVGSGKLSPATLPFLLWCRWKCLIAVHSKADGTAPPSPLFGLIVRVILVDCVLDTVFLCDLQWRYFVDAIDQRRRCMLIQSILLQRWHQWELRKPARASSHEIENGQGPVRRRSHR